MDRLMYVSMDAWINEWLDRRWDGRFGLMDVWMDGAMDGETYE